jgi:preprotein translocase subunit SecB
MNESTETKQQFAIKKLYVKDVSFESPTSPKSFSYKKWEPKIDLNLGNKQAHIDDDIYEAVLSVTATVSIEDETAFLIEVHQAGLFQIAGFEDEQKSYLLGSQCMNILFPYAREVISDMSVRGGFPPLVMSPVNFDALYQQHMQRQQGQQDEASADDEAAEVTH